MQTIYREQLCEAEIEVVWGLVSDSSSWPSWTGIESHSELTPPGPGGTGEVRVFKNKGKTLTEEIVEYEPPHRLAYVLLEGLAIRDYRASISLQQGVGERTMVRWRTEFRAKLPGSGWIYRMALARATDEFIAGLAKEAAQVQRR